MRWIALAGIIMSVLGIGISLISQDYTSACWAMASAVWALCYLMEIA